MPRLPDSTFCTNDLGELDVGMIITCGFIFYFWKKLIFLIQKFTTAEKDGLRSLSTKIAKYQYSQHCWFHAIICASVWSQNDTLRLKRNENILYQSRICSYKHSQEKEIIDYYPYSFSFIFSVSEKFWNQDLLLTISSPYFPPQLSLQRLLSVCLHVICENLLKFIN